MESKDARNMDLQAAPYGDMEYMKTIWERLLNSKDFVRVETEIRELSLPKGVCAKPFGRDDVAWFCKTCQKDSNCLLCQSCFENGCHKGHPVYLDYNISGCCDCGDSDAWDPKGFCCNHQGFIDEAQARIDCLPPLVRLSVPNTIQELVVRVHSLLATLSLYKTELADKAARIEKEIADIFDLLLKISNLSPICLYEVCRNLALRRSESLVETPQGQRQTVPSVPPLRVIDLMMTVHPMLGSKLRKKLEEFCIHHIKSKRFKFELADCYMAHFAAITDSLRLKEQRELAGLGCQLLTVDDIAAQLVANEQHIKTMGNVLQVLTTACKTSRKFNDLRALYHFRFEFKYLWRITSAEPIIHSDFVKTLISCCADFSFAAVFPPLKIHVKDNAIDIVLAAEGELSLLHIFQRLASAIDYTDLPYCQRVAQLFLPYVHKLHEESKQLAGPSFSLPLHRCLTYFLLSYCYINLLVTKPSGLRENPGQCLRTCLKQLLGMQKDEEFNSFVRICLSPVLKAIGFMNEITSHKWVWYGSSLSDVHNTYVDRAKLWSHYDIPLCTLLLASYAGPDPSLCFFILDSLSQNDKWLTDYLSVFMTLLPLDSHSLFLLLALIRSVVRAICSGL